MFKINETIQKFCDYWEKSYNLKDKVMANKELIKAN